MLLYPACSFSQVKPKLQFLSRWDNDRLKAIGNQTFNDIWGWAAPDGREYAIMGAVDSVYFIEITDPLHPELRAAQAGRYNKCIHRDVQTYSHYAYCVADEGASSLQIFDLQYLPDSVHKVYDSDTLIFQAHNLWIEKDRLYIAFPKTLTGRYKQHALIIASLAEPEKPALLSIIESGNKFDFVYDLNVRNDTAFMSCGNKGLWIYDLRDAKNPLSIASITNYPDQGFNHSSSLSADSKTLVFSDENHYLQLKRFDVSGLGSSLGSGRTPAFKSLFGMPTSTLGSIPHNPFIKNGLVYVSYYHDGVAVFNLNDSNKLIDSYDTYPQNSSTNYSGFAGCWGLYPYLPSGTIIASDMTNGLFCLKLDSLNAIDYNLPLKQRFSVFPNPASDHVSVQIFDRQHKGMEYKLFTSRGSLLLNGTIGANQNYTDILLPNPLPSGIYILKFISEGESVIYKVIK